MITPMNVILVCTFYFAFGFVGAGVQIFAYAANVLLGFIVGTLMGNTQMGLTVGAQMTLMSLGVGGFGGSSVPNYALGTIIGTIFAITTGDGLTAALTIGVPAAALGTELDVLGKMSGSFFIHREMDAAERGEFDKMGFWVFSGLAVKAFMTMAPVLLVMTIGADFVNNLIASLPEWFNRGMNVVGGLLPAVGFATLLKYMPVNKYGVYAVLGFALASYLNLGMLPIALIVVVFAFNEFLRLERDAELVKMIGNSGQPSAEDLASGDYDE